MLIRYRSLKFLADRLISLIMICVFSPLFLALAILVFIFLGSPIFFVQERAGLNGRPFPIYKFRTMKNLVNGSGEPLPDSERLTPFGKFLRSTSFDELPSLINVLVGDMSFVGPRPLLVQYLPLYTARQARRHKVRPGISGLAQVRGRNSLTWAEKFDFDIWYVDHQSFLLDFRILMATPLKVLRREGISSSGSVTSSLFRGDTHS